MEEEKNLMFLAKDKDPRVRTISVQKLEQMCSGEWSLSLSSYRAFTNLCNDTEKNVRLSALRIVLAFAEKFIHHQVKTLKGFLIRIQDDAFTLVCHAVNDIEVQVRAEASKLLGCFSSVSDSFLHQTLDKKLMRQMRMLGDEPITQLSMWSTGKKLGEDVPMEKDDEESDSIIPVGACGAFVTALEDEFMAVRQAAVYSLGKLAMNRKDFALLCIDHLADMFNDEIQQVRLDAIHALAPLVTHGILQQDQLYTILTVLDDATTENRMAIHDLISKSNLADSECVRQCIKVLLHSLKRFPLDKPSIYQCLSSVGLKHSIFVHSMVTELLEIHPIFDTPEQNIEDNFYLGKLILVLNAASQRPVICSLIPAYVKKHYRYLRYSTPELIPIVKEIDDAKFTSWRLDKNLNAKEIENTSVKILNDYQNDGEIRFFAGLPVGISFKCLIYNLKEDHLKNVRIEVTYPNQEITLFRPRNSDFHRLEGRLSHKCFRLQTKTIVTSAVWAVPADIQLICGFIEQNKKMKKFIPFSDSDRFPKINKSFVKIFPVLRP